jgi:hypothetical protein
MATRRNAATIRAAPSGTFSAGVDDGTACDIMMATVIDAAHRFDAHLVEAHFIRSIR